MISLQVYETCQALVWFADFPPELRLSGDTINSEVKCRRPANQCSSRKIILELRQYLGPRYCYGCLGAQFISDNEKSSLDVAVTYTQKPQQKRVEGLIPLGDEGHVEMKLPFAEAVMAAVNSKALALELGPGKLTFQYGANACKSSSRHFFTILTSIILELLSRPDWPPEEEVIRGVIRDVFRNSTTGN